MKEWNAPSIEELNVTETANGFFDADFETFFVLNDNKSNTPKDDKEDSVNQLS